MITKTFNGLTEKGLKKQVEEFISREGVKVLELQYVKGEGYMVAMLMYEETAGEE